MRANEFIVEASLSQEVGNWMSKQSIGAKMKQKANARKANVPTIAKAVQQMLAMQVDKLLNNDTISTDKKATLLDKLIIAVMEKSTKVDISANENVFGKDMTTLLTAIRTNIKGVATNNQVLELVRNIVDKSFTVDTSFKLSNKAIATRFAKIYKDAESPEEAAQEIANNLAKEGFDEAEAKEKAAELVKGLQAAEQDGTDDEPTDSGQTTTGVDIDELKLKIKEYMLDRPDEYGRDRDIAADFIQTQLEKNGMEDENQIVDISDELMQDPEMPFNASKVTGEFRALAYSPNGLRYKKDGDEDGDNIAFVKYKGAWSQWQVGPRSSWRYEKKVSDKRDLVSLVALAKQGTTQLTPMIFRQDELEGEKNLYRVSAR